MQYRPKVFICSSINRSVQRHGEETSVKEEDLTGRFAKVKVFKKVPLIQHYV